jgi:RNA polymerase sigma factor (sigma-70 family)
MADDRAVIELERLLADRADHLMRTAVLLAGSRDDGQDLLRAALRAAVPGWSRLDGDPEACLRRVLYNLAADGFRRQGRLRQKLTPLRPVTGQSAAPAAAVDLRDALVRLMLQLPARQRVVLVLRFWEQLTEPEAAALLGWPEGTVRSATSHGLARLQELADGWPQADDQSKLVQARLRVDDDAL